MRRGEEWERADQEEVTLRAPRRSESPDSRSFARERLRNQPAAPIPVNC